MDEPVLVFRGETLGVDADFYTSVSHYRRFLFPTPVKDTAGREAALKRVLDGMPAAAGGFCRGPAVPWWHHSGRELRVRVVDREGP